MKAILISIKPKYVAKILNGEKTIEIRKTMPKCDLPIDVYIYCTKDGECIAINPYGGYAVVPNKDKNEYFNGKVVAKFTLNKVEKVLEHITDTYMSYCTNSINCDEFFEKTCLTIDELEDYLNWNKGGYAIHISDLEIFDKPKELSEFKTRHYPQFVGMVRNKTHYELKPLTKAPQSMCYIDVE